MDKREIDERLERIKQLFELKWINEEEVIRQIQEFLGENTQAMEVNKFMHDCAEYDMYYYVFSYLTLKNELGTFEIIVFECC